MPCFFTSLESSVSRTAEISVNARCDSELDLQPEILLMTPDSRQSFFISPGSKAVGGLSGTDVACPGESV